MKIFVDYHHSTLHKSLQMLFEDRLGYELYRPIGSDWFDEGYWKIAEPYGNNPATIAQYLGMRDFQPVDGSRPLNTIKDKKPDYYLIADPFKPHKAITLEQFKNMEFDIVMATYDKHIDPYMDLVKKYQPKAKFVCQIGNDWPVNLLKVKNLMASVAPYDTPSNANVVFYHQEIDMDMFGYTKPNNSNLIRSFVNCLSSADMFENDWKDFLELEKRLPYKFESYGGGCRDGIVQQQSDVARMMKESKFGVHLKTGGDGFGHTIFDWFAVGRPLIVRRSQYAGKLAGKLLNPQTCFNLDEGIDKVVKQIESCDYERMCEIVHNTFMAEVDFEEEEYKIKKFLDKLI